MNAAHYCYEFANFKNPVGAGRYDIHKWSSTQYINGHESAFNSKVNRDDPITKSVLKYAFI